MKCVFKIFAVASILVALAASSPVKAETSFIEAVTFFLTGVDATGDEIVSEREIHLHKYPLVVYLVDDKRCVVRVRNTTTQGTWPLQVWQLDFCKITGYQWVSYWNAWVWIGEPGVFFCAAKWSSNENYMDPDFTKLGKSVKCHFPPYGSEFQGNWDADLFTFGSLNMNLRSQQRLMASYKYIEYLLTGKPY
jgi:hypothetical protein